ncbi:peptidase G2 autoproteolytic cleavage domain-containing protein [Staphylococcus sp. LCT-H4]|uniref:peptidase G2 autoproteolytic cleavage domain-containing protein n=1 Tax=Staphylococcus sp. LCT-H4 TaxID=1914308 RepID=UPI0008F4EB86|nr:peptidase G2 autoproteolytic cleavage domain-containing protein [Staphylococcus sp. LCT-H4]OIJ29057.1 peptidase G2 [Staphylococcus sp. LCT-H4]
MRIYTDLPIELGQEWRYKTVDNFKNILDGFNAMDKNFEYHKTEESHAHKAKQIDYKLSNVHDELTYQDGRIEGLIIGHNGDGIQEVTDARTALDGSNQPLLSKRLKYDFDNMNKKIEDNYNKLNKKIERIVNVNDFGADPTGNELSDEAFKEALGSGNVHVHMTAGTYKIKNGIKLPSNSVLSGEGKGISIIKLSDDSPRETVAVTNRDMDGTARNISTESFTIHGNKERFTEKYVSNGVQFQYPAPSGGSLSSNLRFAGVTNGYAYNIESINPLLHGIDVTSASDTYFYEGDGVRVNEALESKYIHIDNCETSGHGDDGITTHHSRYINITNNVSHDPKNYHGNSNGIEVDDGSQYVFLANNYTYNNQCGIEIKGHGEASASAMVVVDGHISYKDNRSYVVRHIAHHVATDPKSKTAKDVMFNNIVSLYPTVNGVYEGWSPRAMVICAYENVSVNNFTAIGDGTFTAGYPAIAVQYRAENVQLHNINVRGFKTASADIKIYGGDNRPKKVTFSNINIHSSSNNIGIAGGAGVYDTKIIGANLIGNGTGNAIESYNSTMTIIGVQHEGYTNGALIMNKAYKDVPSALRGGLVAGSTGSGAISKRSVVLASTGESFAYSDRSWLLGAGMKSQARGSRSGIMNSLESETTQGSYSQTIVNSRGVKVEDNYMFAMGYGTDGAKYQNTRFQVKGTSGTVKAKGTITAGNDFGDYAEYFESQSGQEIPNGHLVTLDGRYIRKANSNDVPIGVISGTAGIVLGDAMFHHKDKFLKDEFGVTLTQTEKKEWQDDEGNWYSEEVEVPIPNPEWEESDGDYLDRASRPEWNVVGLMGQVFTRIDSTVQANDYIKPEKGIGTKDNNNGYYRVLEITTPYDSEKGYGVAVVLVK